MRCEKCGAADAQIIKQETVLKGTRIARMYKCRECGGKFITLEIYEKRYAALLKGAKLISEMAEMANKLPGVNKTIKTEEGSE